MNKLDKYIILNYVKSFILGMMMFFLIFLLAESISLTGWIMDQLIILFPEELKNEAKKRRCCRIFW